MIMLIAPHPDVVQDFHAAINLEQSAIKVADEELYEHYRQGFVEELAHSMAEYTRMYRSSEPALFPPGSPVIVFANEKKATLIFRAHPYQKQMWQTADYISCHMVKEGDHWLIKSMEELQGLGGEHSETPGTIRSYAHSVFCAH